MWDRSCCGSETCASRPTTADRVQMRAVGGDEMQLDASAGLRQPLSHKSGMMIARIVQKHVDQRRQMDKL